MKHVHRYETEAHLGINPRLMEMTPSAEIKCRTAARRPDLCTIREGDWLLFWMRKRTNRTYCLPEKLIFNKTESL